MGSKFLRLNTRDFLRGLIVVVICSFITGIYQLMANGFAFNWLTIRPVLVAAVGAGISYLTKNLLSNSKGDFMKSEPEEKPDNGKEII